MELSAGRMDDSSATWFDKRVKKNFCMYVHVYACMCMLVHVCVCV